MRMRFSGLSAAGLVLAASLLLAEEAPVVKATLVAGNVYMIEGMGGNMGASVGDDGILLVDDQMAPVLERIRAALAELSKGDLRFILNTHFHGDHTGNNPALGTDATIIAQANVRKRLIAPQAGNGERVEAMDPSGWPVITFDQSVSVHFNGEEILVMHVPSGHTDGDAIVYFTKSNVLHMGDQLFTGRFPFVDLAHGGTVDGFAQNLDMVLRTVPRDASVIPGHGPLSTMDDVRASHDMIVETVAIVRDQMKAGKTLDEIKQEGLPDKFASFDGDFIPTDRWIETIWNSYAEQKGNR